jgi:hypothetical protein
MKIAIIISLLLLCSIAKAQRVSFRGENYEKKRISTNVDKRIYIIWKDWKTFIYPNPTRGEVYFSRYGDVIVMDVTGRIIKKEKDVNQIDLYGLAAGTYFITIITDDFVSHHLEVKL